MAVKPTDLPEWATDPGADKTAPPIAKQEGGWLPLEKPPHQWFNWFFNLVYQWLAWVKSGSSVASLSEGWQKTSPGDVVLVQGPGTIAATEYAIDSWYDGSATVQTGYSSLATDGRYIFAFHFTYDTVASTSTAKIVRFDSGDLASGPTELDSKIATVSWLGNPTLSYSLSRDLLAYVWESNLKVVDSGGKVVFSGAVSMDILDVCITDDSLIGSYVVCMKAGGVTVYDDTWASGTPSAPPGALTACCQSRRDPGLFYLTSNDTTSYIYKYRASLSSLIGDSEWPMNSRVALNNEPIEGGVISDGSRVYVATSDGVEAFFENDGEAAWATSISGTIREITTDGAIVYLLLESEIIVFLDAVSGQVIRKNTRYFPQSPFTFTTDGQRIFIGSETSSGGLIQARHTGRGPLVFSHVDPTESEKRPLDQILQPPTR